MPRDQRADQPGVLADGPNPEVPDRWLMDVWRDMPYEIRVAPTLLSNPAPIEPPRRPDGTCAPLPRHAIAFVDSNLESDYATRLNAVFAVQPFTTKVVFLDVSEEQKTVDLLLAVLTHIDKADLDRRDVIIAVGGGVLTDVVCLAASLYKRGTPAWRWPTTLLGMVDAATGVKTGVNLLDKKNLIGTYYPADTWIDPAFLDTLPLLQRIAGGGEVLKMGLIARPDLFDLLAEFGARLVAEGWHPGSSVAAEATTARSWAIDSMVRELAKNICEHLTLERSVDHGHWVGPPLEMAALPDLPHGCSVAICMAFTATISLRRGWLSLPDYDRILTVTKSLSLPIYHPKLTEDLVTKALISTTRTRGGLPRIPLLYKRIGQVKFVNNLPQWERSWALMRLRAEDHRRAAA